MKRPIVIVAAVLILGVAVFLVLRPQGPAGGGAEPAPAPGASAPARSAAPVPGSPGTAPGGTPQPAVSVDPKLAALQDPRALDPDPLPLDFTRPPFEKQKNGSIFKRDVMATVKDLHDPEQEPLADVEILGSLVNSYREIFRENPIAGENWEVVAALTGKNRYKLVLLDPGHPAIRDGRELVDRWGTPYRFHAISRSHMEIVSAGEDRQFGTGDDIMADDPTVIGDRGPGSPVNARDESEAE